MKMRRYTVEELRNLQIAFKHSKEHLEKQLTLINESLETINNTLKLNVSQKGVEVVLPEDLFNFDSIEEEEESIKWREEILNAVGNSDTFLSVREIYSKLRIKYPHKLKDERKCIKTISSALVFMVRDGRIGQNKNDNKKLIFGDINKHFTLNGTKKTYLQ